ncbi:MAG TPA: glycoside hydrolase family 16 protein [Ideonella sp.]|uniref:glycoside hydrolase family 16 protein n=1 Tax=Ideonella sp. TaxID=1929293 RepID=UPI002C3EF663|nr:glycoside hydrolase family 16 protein [Ideonella sp.]HSI50555.1 glycoside hydrolase family 16 protein [Ideonella sp.]
MTSRQHRRRDVLTTLGGLGLGGIGELCTAHANARDVANVANVAQAAWTPAALGERVWLDWRAEDLVDGPVSQWKDRVVGMLASQGDTTRQPVHTSDGVLFQSGARRLLIPAQAQAFLAHRAVLMIFKVDFTGSTSADGSFAAFNGYDGSTTSRQPAMLYKNDGATRTLSAQWRDPRGYYSQPLTISNDTAQWHCAITRRVGGTAYSSIDGSPEFATGAGAICLPRSTSATGLIGDYRDDGPKWTLDCLIVLQDELSLADAQRLAGWAMWRKGAQAQLPSTHPYRNSAPLISVTDGQAVYAETTPDQWTTLKAYWDSTDITLQLEQSFRKPLNLVNYQLVFQDTFDIFSVTDEVTGAGPWYSPVHPDATGAAKTAKLTTSPPPFVQQSGEMIVRMQQGASGWQSGVFTSVNLNGKGRSWLYGYFEMRARAKSGNGYGSWPAFWLKTTNEFFRLTETRVEIDAYEGYATDTKGHHQSFHNWPAARLMAGRLTTHRYLSNYVGLTATQWGSDVNLFDNAYHTYGVLVTPDWIIYYFDRLELARFPTPIEAKKPLFLLVDLAMNSSEVSKASGTSELGVDYIQVYQKK